MRETPARLMIVRLLPVLLTLLLFSGMLRADGPAATPDPAAAGRAIMEEADRRAAGWNDSTATTVMTLKNRNGEVSTRKMRIKALEQTSDGDLGLVIFDEPRDVRGTALLTHTHRESEDDQWLYLPALKRVKRIASRNRSGPFMGSEFAYEDLSSQEIDKYDYRLIAEETYRDNLCWVVERYPREPSGYTRQVIWLDQAEYRPLKTEFYDRRSALLKTLDFYDYRLHQDKFWRSHRMVMVNHQTGKSTTIAWQDLAFGIGLTASDFDKASLKRLR